MPALPAGFASTSADVDGFRMHYLIGGEGSPVVLVHGAFESWYAWREVAVELSRTHTVIVPAIRGLAESGKPLSGYDGNTLGEDLFVLLSGLGYDAVQVVGHDWGGQAAYTLAAQHRDFVTRLAIFEWAIPGTGHIEAAMTPRADGRFLWHMGLLSVPDIPELLLKGSLRPFFDHFFSAYAAVRGAVSVEALSHYVDLYERPGALRAFLAIYQEYWTDVEQSNVHRATPLSIPVLAYGGELSFGPATLASVSMAAEEVRGGVIDMCGHWVAEEQPGFVIDQLQRFLGT